MKIACVILCRYNSTRLPGKALRELNGKASLLHTYERLLQFFDESQVIVATSNQSSDDPIVNFCRDNSMQFYRGSLDNVAERFCAAGEALDADFSFRVNGDNIFIDLEVLKEAVELAQEGKYDFVSNVKGRTFPKGMSIEGVRVAHYKDLLPKIETSVDFKEHVTLYLYQNEKQTYKFIYNKSFPDFGGVQIALDTAEDFENIERIIKNMGNIYPHYNFEDLIKAYE